MKSLWFRKVVQSHTCVLHVLAWIRGICFEDDNGNCGGSCLPALFGNETPHTGSTDKFISNHSIAYPKLSKRPSQLADACTSLNSIVKTIYLLFSFFTQQTSSRSVLITLRHQYMLFVILVFCVTDCTFRTYEDEIKSALIYM